MKFFLDTANLKEIREAASWGAIDGVPTNPSLIAKEGGVDFKEHIRTICGIVDGPVSAEVVSVYEFETQILLASARHPLYIVQGAVLGAHIATMPFKVLEQLTRHPLTDIGLENF